MKNDEKRMLRIELDSEVKKVSITGMNSEEKVVLRQELNEDELKLATGGVVYPYKFDRVVHKCDFHG